MGKDKRRNKSRTGKSRSAQRAINAARRLKIIPVLIKDLNRMVEWMNALSVVQVAIIETAQALADLTAPTAPANPDAEKFRFKDGVDNLVKAHLAAQQAAQPQPITEPVPDPEILDAVNKLSQQISEPPLATDQPNPPTQ